MTPPRNCQSKKIHQNRGNSPPKQTALKTTCLLLPLTPTNTLPKSSGKKTHWKKNKKLYQLHQVLRHPDIIFQSQIGIRLQAQQKQHLLGNKKIPQDNTSSTLCMANQRTWDWIQTNTRHIPTATLQKSWLNKLCFRLTFTNKTIFWWKHHLGWEN